VIAFEGRFCSTVLTTRFSSWVKTEMGNHAAKLFGEAEAEIEVEESVRGIIAVIDRAESDLETYSGRFLSYTGGDYPW
jgi:norsolorinic acid ketoreductase